MWYEILAPLGIITGAMVCGLQGGTWLLQLIKDRPHWRLVNRAGTQYHYQRDKRLTGDPYVFNNLDAIPDEPKQ